MTAGALDPALRRLAGAVLAQAARDAAGQGIHAAQARGWLQSHSEGLLLWCACAGVAPDVVQRWEVRPFTLPEDDGDPSGDQCAA